MMKQLGEVGLENTSASNQDPHLPIAYTVLMAVYRGEKAAWFRESLQSMLDQTWPPDEFVLVCDGPLTTALEAVVDWFAETAASKLQLIRLDQQSGLGIAANMGLQSCSNEWVVRMDSDDLARPDRCQMQLRFAQENSLDVTSAWVEEFSDQPDHVTGVRRLPELDTEIKNRARRRNPINHPCVAYRKSLVLETGGYRNLSGFEDYDLWARLILKDARFGNLPEILLAMRAGSGLYKRRGGLAYTRKMISFWREMIRIGFVGWPRGLANMTIRSIVSLMPNISRRAFYQTRLRNNADK